MVRKIPNVDKSRKRGQPRKAILFFRKNFLCEDDCSICFRTGTAVFPLFISFSLKTASALSCGFSFFRVVHVTNRKNLGNSFINESKLFRRIKKPPHFTQKDKIKHHLKTWKQQPSRNSMGYLDSFRRKLFYPSSLCQHNGRYASLKLVYFSQWKKTSIFQTSLFKNALGRIFGTD